MVKKNVIHLKTLERQEFRSGPSATQEVVEVAEVGVNEENSEEAEPHRAGEEEGLAPVQVRRGREEEMNYMVKTLEMFEFGS